MNGFHIIPSGETKDLGDGVTLHHLTLSSAQIFVPEGTHVMGFIQSGTASAYLTSARWFQAGDFFALNGPINILNLGEGMLLTIPGYLGLPYLAGRIAETGLLEYIDGCSDSVLVHPIHKGDPCLNHLHFPPKIKQSPHTHPSYRVGMVASGHGHAKIGTESVPLTQGTIFHLEPDIVHSFETDADRLKFRSNTMDIVVFHPDSDVGHTDEDHPMINRTILE